MRGMGVAGKLLTHAIQRCSNMVPDIIFVAEVRDTNVQSQSLFNKLNFTRMRERNFSISIILNVSEHVSDPTLKFFLILSHYTFIS